jgi:hypothetical protein
MITAWFFADQVVPMSRIHRSASQSGDADHLSSLEDVLQPWTFAKMINIMLRTS